MTTQTETVLTQRAQPNGVLLTQLKTVQWVKSVGVVQYGQTLVERRYRTVKSIPVVSWALASIEMIFTSALLFITTLPWPTFIVNLLNKVDTFVEGAFETVTNKVEWWYDSIMVRLIRLRDSIESFLDTILSIGVFVTYKAIDVLAAGAAVVIATTRAAISPFLWLGAVFGLTKIEATQPEQNHINQKVN